MAAKKKLPRKQRPAKKTKKKSSTRPKSSERRERLKANLMSKRHKQKLLDAKLSRQKQRNNHVLRMRRNLQAQRKADEEEQQQQQQQEQQQQEEEEEDDNMAQEDKRLLAQHLGEAGCFKRLLLRIGYLIGTLLHFFATMLRSERTFDWLIFLANNLGLYQEYEINDYGQRLSPRTGRPVLLSLGPIRVVQVVESANQVRSHWDPYIREYLKKSNLTTDCWRANRMALQVALCMDEKGNMYDMPIHNSLGQQSRQAAATE